VQPAGVAGGVHHVLCGHRAADTVGGDVLHATDPILLGDDVTHVAALLDLHAVPGRVAQQDVVESGPLDLERGRRRLGQPR